MPGVGVIKQMLARFNPGENVPGFATALVRAGRFVRVTGPKTVDGDYPIAECGKGERAFGVAERTALSEGEDPQRTSWRRRTNVVRRGAIGRVTAGEALVAPVEVESDAQGRAVKVTTGKPLGIAVASASEAGKPTEIDLF